MSAAQQYYLSTFLSSISDYYIRLNNLYNASNNIPTTDNLLPESIAEVEIVELLLVELLNISLAQDYRV